MTELKLEVDKTYVDREGNNVTISRVTDASGYAFMSSEDKTYMENGRYVQTVMSGYDLISEYVEPTPAAPARTPLKWAKERHAHADGYEIEGRWLCYSSEQDWVIDHNPRWNTEREFRIKPEPAPLKPTEEWFVALLYDGTLYPSMRSKETFMRCVGDGITKAIHIKWNPNDQTLVSAEVVTL